MKQTGICYLVGAGPGDPGLMTVRGMERLRKAEVVFYDRLVSTEILDAAPVGAEMVYVGKACGRHPIPQERISELICDAVRDGHVVVRLKGGDPFVFGRGGEEAIALAQAQLPFEIVPGVTAGVAAPAYAGIPITHRGVATAVTFVTGHEAPGKVADQTDWEGLAKHAHTLCIYMGIRKLPMICASLIRGGRPASEPAAVVEWGTLARQRCITGTLADIAAKVQAEQMKPPAMVVVGEVVELRDVLQWFDGPVCFPEGNRVAPMMQAEEWAEERAETTV